MKKLTIVLLASLFAAAGLFAQKSPVVATVDVQRVLNDYTEFKSAVEKIKGSVAPAQEEIEKIERNIRGIVEKGQAAEAKVNNPALGEEAREEAQAEFSELQQQLRQEQAKLQQFRQQAQAEAQKGQQEELQPLQEKAIEAVQQVAKDKGVDLVLASNNVVYADESLDISDAVIALLNAEAE